MVAQEIIDLTARTCQAKTGLDYPRPRNTRLAGQLQCLEGFVPSVPGKSLLPADAQRFQAIAWASMTRGSKALCVKEIGDESKGLLKGDKGAEFVFKLNFAEKAHVPTAVDADRRRSECTSFASLTATSGRFPKGDAARRCCRNSACPPQASGHLNRASRIRMLNSA